MNDSMISNYRFSIAPTMQGKLRNFVVAIVATVVNKATIENVRGQLKRDRRHEG